MKTKEYALITAQIKKLEIKHKANMVILLSQQSLLKEKILSEMKKNKEKSVVDDYGKFTRTVRKYYTYSAKTNAINERWKTAKVKEEQSGSAKVKSESVSLRYTPNEG